ncbi:MAG TPA: hypothetical protein VMZ28_12645 [Kofleriaceae bacterium]|nr:hypothetical protein [Kofleriaceae bacterium]
MKRAAALAVVITSHASVARGGPETEVASAFDTGDKLDVHVSVEYRFVGRRAAIKREMAGLPGADPDGPVPLVKDLVFAGARHELVPRLEVGLFTDVALTATLPIILRDTRKLSFDQRAGDCVFPTDPGAATCIDRSNSSTIADGILPEGGFDGNDADGGGTSVTGETIFRGVNRSGIDQIHVGGVWAPMNQARDATKPTWKVGAELRLAVGKVMKLDRMNAPASDGVSRGVHEVRLYTSMARRLGWAEPFFEVWWLVPVGVKEESPLAEPDEPYGAEQTQPQQHAGGRFGFEAVAWESRTHDERVGVHASGAIEGHFEGRAYSDMWEVFAYAGDARAGGPLRLDSDPVRDDEQAISHPGASNVENYMTLAGRAGVDTHLGRRVRLDLSGELGWEQSHLISFADAGVDGGDDNDVIDAGTEEVNPLHAPLIDAVGHRYRVDEALNYLISVNLRLLF